MLSTLARVLLALALLQLPSLALADVARAPRDSLMSAPGASAVGESFFIDAGDTIWLSEPIEVLGSRIPAALPGVLRQVTVLTGSTLERLPGRSTNEMLAAVPGVQAKQRAQYGVQADLSIRGSTFNQVQVLLDGIDMSDPQTGHNLLSLPLGLFDVDKLEILPGHGSALYGSGAFGGTVNVVPRKPATTPGGSLAVTGGENGTWGARGAADLLLGGTTVGPRARVSVEHFKTDGYTMHAADGTSSWSGTDADTWTATAHLVNSCRLADTDFFCGYAHREFGARDFYAPYPSLERTEAIFGAARFRRDLSRRVTIEKRLYCRRHKDRFVLFRNDPDRFTNNHVTHRAGAELRSLATLGQGFALASTFEGVYEDITSTMIYQGVPGSALGDHERKRFSLAVELAQNQAPVRYQVGVRLDARSEYRARFSESVAVAWDYSEHLIVRGSAGTVFRVPTYTELYYAGGGNQGSADLESEQGWTWDCGLASYHGAWSLTAAYFERFEDDLIDWVRPTGSTADVVWQATNIAEGTTRGCETAINWQSARYHTVGLGFTKLEKSNTLPAGSEGKYNLVAPRYLISVAGTAALPHEVFLTLAGRYIEHTGGTADYAYSCVVDSRLDWRPMPYLVTIRVTNLLDRRYEEIPGVQMPGRLITTTVGWNF